MLGYDTKYIDDLEDEKLIDIAQSDDRILLTRDHELYRRACSKLVDAFLVEDETQQAQLKALSHRYNLRLQLDPNSSRCPLCNTPLSIANKELIIEKIPQTTANVYSEFWKCQGCEKIYWKGAHWEKILQTLDAAEN
jgi:uncharacterized protein with PIN domain